MKYSQKEIKKKAKKELMLDAEEESNETVKEINYINKGNKEMIDKTKIGYIYIIKSIRNK